MAMVVGIAMTLIFNYPCMVIGRFITGFAADVFQSDALCIVSHVCTLIIKHSKRACTLYLI